MTMSTKIKGLFKGIRYISHIFGEEPQKEQDMQIGLPTDVKHVAHAGWDGSPTSANADNSSRTRDFNPSTPGDFQANKDSEDSKRVQRTKKSQEKDRQQGEGPKSTRRRSTDTNNLTSELPIKPTRRLSADNATAGGGGSDVPKKTRRKKSDSIEGRTRRPKNKATAAATNGDGDATTEDDEEKEDTADK